VLWREMASIEREKVGEVRRGSAEKRGRRKRGGG
jgi:hypothetical protein